MTWRLIDRSFVFFGTETDRRNWPRPTLFLCFVFSSLCLSKCCHILFCHGLCERVPVAACGCMVLSGEKAEKAMHNHAYIIPYIGLVKV